jgi:hypothetical protein
MILLGCAVLAVGHLNFSQGLAWMSMLIARGATMSVDQAVATTFDGQHPCGMCTMVKAERANDDQVPARANKVDKKPVFTVNQLVLPVTVPIGVCVHPESGDLALVGIAISPETPPPQALI